jgi:uncharacterized protein
MAETISLDFGQPIALFPLPGLALLPHAVQALHVFEPRYRQMVEEALAAATNGQILTAAPLAMASYAADSEADDDEAPPVRPAVCIGKIVQHQKLRDGCHNILVQGVCRARIRGLVEPTPPERLYRMAMLEPLERVSEPPPSLPGVRGAIKSRLNRPRLGRMAGAPMVLEWIARKDVPTHALLELVGFSLINDEGTRYRLLAEPDPTRRATLITRELDHLDAVVAKADLQGSKDWPKGLSWN